MSKRSYSVTKVKKLKVYLKQKIKNKKLQIYSTEQKIQAGLDGCRGACQFDSYEKPLLLGWKIKS
jgi:hypothetical protein